MAAKKKGGDEIYVAKESGHAEIDGREYVFHQGRTRVSGDSVLAKMKGFAEFFEPVDEHLSYQTEEATAAPGERRDVYLGHETGRPDEDDTDPAALEYQTVVQLRKQADELGVKHSGLNKADLIAAIASADQGDDEEGDE